MTDDATANHRVELLTVRAGDPAYDELLGPIRADAVLMRRIWADSESRLPAEPGKVWCIAAVHTPHGRLAAAWAAAFETEVDGRPVLQCCDSYEMPAWRGSGLYAAAYAHRHTEVVLPAARRGLPAITYVFAQPLALHLADGWAVTGEGDSAEPDAPAHHWYQMRRPAVAR